MKKWILIMMILCSFKVLGQSTTSGYCGPKDGNGNYGTNCEWNYDEDSKTLKIWGEGAMYNSTQVHDFPWSKNSTFYNEIENVVIENGITRIGVLSFHDAQSLKNFTIPNSVNVIYSHAFTGTSLKSLVIPDGVNALDGNAENNLFNKSLETLYCSEKLKLKCQQQLSFAGIDATRVLKTYQKYGNEYYFDGKFYQSPNDIGTPNYIKKRIYTIDEANRIAGDKNRVSIKYR